MIKRIIAVLLVVSIISVCFLGCGAVESVDTNSDNIRFKVVERVIVENDNGSEGWATILVDTETGVLYLRRNGSNTSSYMTVLLNADGTPMIWEGE